MLRRDKEWFEIVAVIFVCLFLVSVAQAGWREQAKLTASDGEYGDYFGWSISVSGDYSIVGSRHDDDNGTQSGSAYVFKRSCGTWTEQSKLLASDGNDYDHFGYCVSIDGNYAVVGAPLEDANGLDNSGSAYIFERDPNTEIWTQQVKLTASDGAGGDNFGISVSISGGYCLVGARGDDDNGSFSGSAYIFERSNIPNDPNWYEQDKLTALGGAEGDFFGRSVFVSGDQAIVGALGHDVNGLNHAGSAYIFKRDPNTESWTQQTEVTALDGEIDDNFGISVSISGGYCVVGAYGDDDNGSFSGSAYIFKRDPNTDSWTQQTKMVASDGDANDFFGGSVAISGDMVVIGAAYDDANGASCGSAYIFELTDANWVEASKLTASDGADLDSFGHSVSISGDYCIVGAFGDDSDTGSVYSFGANVVSPAVDLNNDCTIDLRDLAVITRNWLATDAVNLASSCLGHWKMNDDAANTTVVDSSDYANDGTAQQNTSVLHTTGKIDGAFTFNGSSDVVQVSYGPELDFATEQRFTVAAWIYADNFVQSGGIFRRRVSKGIIFEIQDPKRLRGYIDGAAGATGNFYSESNVIEEDTWYFVAMVSDGNNVGFYIDGVPSGTPADISGVGDMTDTLRTLKIGRSAAYFNGIIDNVMVFDKALTAEEIGLLYNGGTGTETFTVGQVRGDINDDGIVNFLDFAEFANAW